MQITNAFAKIELKLENLAQRICVSGRLIPLWLVPLFVGIFLFPISGTTVTPDGASYLSLGYNLYNGLGYIDSEWNPVIFRGPVFPGLLASMFTIFGASIQSAVGLVRIFFVLNGVLTYAITSHFTNRLVGLFASLLLLTSTTIYVWSTRIHYDNIVPFFMLASCYLLIVSLDSQKKWISIVGGVLLGCGFLTKDVAILLAPFPILLWLFVPAYRNRKNLIYPALFLITFMSMAGAWFAYVYTIDGLSRFSTMANWVLAIGFGSGSEPARTVAVPTIVDTSASVQPALWGILTRQIAAVGSKIQRFYEVYVEENFAFSFLFVCAWCIVFVETIRTRSSATIFLTFGFFLFSPIILFLGEVQLRAGQNVFLYILSYVALTYSLWLLIRLSSRPRLLFCLVLLPLICIQLFVGKTAFSAVLFPHNSTGYITQLGTNGIGWEGDELQIRGWHEWTVVQAGDWLKAHVEVGEKVLTDWEWGESFYFYLGAHQPIHEIKYIVSQNLLGAKTETPSPISFIWTQAGRTSPSASLSFINAFSESLFLSQIREENIRYVVFGERRNFLSIYLRTHPDFVQVAEFENGRIQIFEVTPDAKLNSLDNFPLFVSTSIKPYLRNMRNQRNVKEYDLFKQTYFYNDLALSEKRVQELELGTVSGFRYNTIISHKQYAKIIKNTKPELFLQAIESYKQQAINSPNNPWTYLSLSYLYQANGQDILAKDAFAQALSFAHTEPLVYSTLIEAIKDPQTLLASDDALQEELISALQEVIDSSPENIRTYWQLAEAQKIFGNSDGAMDVYQQALSVWPNSAGTMLRIARQYQSENQLRKAESAYRAMLTMSPDDQNLPDTVDIHIALGKILLAREQGNIQ